MARSISCIPKHIMVMAILFCACSFFLCEGGSIRHILVADKLQTLQTANYDQTTLSATQRALMGFPIKPFIPRAFSHAPLKIDDIAGEILGKSSTVSSVDEAAAILETKTDVPNGPNPLHNEESPIHKLTP